MMEYQVTYIERIQALDDIEQHKVEDNSVFEELSEDLQKEVIENITDGPIEIGRLSIWEEGQEYHNPLTDYHYIWIEAIQRIGIGAHDSMVWADVDSVDQGLYLYFNEPEEFDNRN
jgi:hypothetical protein